MISKAKKQNSAGTRIGKVLWQQKYLYLMLAPMFLYLILFNYIPMYGAVIAFKNFNPRLGIMGSPWVGFDHFVRLFNSIYFTRLFGNTIIISLLNLLWGFPAPIILALLLNEVRQKKIKRTVQTITYLPYFLSWIIVSGFIITMLSPSTGAIKGLLGLLGVNYDAALLADPKAFRTILVSSGIWKEIGWGSILYLAAIAGINTELYDAAEVDGAGRIRKMLSVTIPGIFPTIVVLLILRSGQMMNSNFDQIFMLLRPSTYGVGDVISTYVYREGILKSSYSFPTAINLFSSVINFFIIIATNKICRIFGGSIW